MGNIIKQRRIFSSSDFPPGGPFLPISGGNLTGNLNGVTPTELTYLSGVTGPIQNQINNIITGLSWKDSVRAATTGNITLSGTQTIDGVALIATNRVLVKDQTDPTENGLYVVNAGAWTRTTDADTGAELLQATVMVEEGALNADTMWTGTADDPITIGVTALPFIKTSATTYTSSNGITLTGNNFTLTTGFFSGDATIVNGVITIDPNFVSNTLGTTCIPLIQVSTIDSCSPLAINPTNLQFVGIGIAIPTAKLHIKGAASDTTHGLLVQNSFNALSLQVRNDGSVYNLGKGSITTNTAFGISALIANTIGLSNTAFGVSSLAANTTGNYSSGFGNQSLQSNQGGVDNNAFGFQTLVNNISGNYNNAFGNLALTLNIVDKNTAFGGNSLQNTLNGEGNTAIGYGAGYSNSSGANSVFLGRQAGFFETASNKLFIDNVARASEADGRIKALIYGVFAATPATQFLNINANVNISTLAGTGERLISVTATGDLTTGATPTLVTGGGTLALGGFTLTVPATGTAVLGTGATSRVALWSGTNTLTSLAAWTYSATTGHTYNSSINTAVLVESLNGNGGGNASSGFQAQSGSTFLFRQYGNGFTPAVGLITGALSMIRTDSTVGMLFANATAATKFWWSIGGTASADEVMRLTSVGLGVKTLADPNSTLHTGGSFATAYRGVSATYTADITDTVINATANTFTINLPTAVGITGRQYVIKNSGAGIITIDAAGTETIDGALTAVLAVQYGSFTVISDGANWGIY